MILKDSRKLKRKQVIIMLKYYKIVFGFNEDDYLSITSDELHKAQVIAIEGGKAIFEAGFFNNRGNDVMRIVPDWHRVRGWNKGYKMTALDHEDIEPLVEDYRKTLANGKLLAEFIIKENRRELLSKPASEVFKEVKQLHSPINKFLNDSTKALSDKFKI